MRTFRYYLICSAFFFLEFSLHPQEKEQASVQRSPEFEFITLAGGHVSSANLKGKVIILDFWSTDCTPCLKSMPQLEELYQKYKGNQRVAIFLVNSGWETIEKAKRFADTKRSTFLFFSWGTRYDLPFAYDQGSKTLNAFGLDSNPSMVIIDSKFRIRLRHSGFMKDIKGFLAQNIDQYLAED